MKKCFKFSTWEEQKDVMISLDENKIVLSKEIEPGCLKVCVAGWMRNSLRRFDKVIDFSNADYWEDCKDRYQEAYGELFDDLYHYLGKECNKQFDEIENREKGISQLTPPDPILAKLCELTGAKMYGDYVVLNEIKNDYFNNDTVTVGDIMYFDYITGDVSDNYVLACTNVQDYEFYNHVEDNVFEEYSKYLRKAPHHWQSYKKILKI